jgi:general stress protein CsbA
MREHLALYIPAVIGVISALVLWIMLARKMTRVGRSRWRAVLLCLPLLLGAVGYGLFWFGFFSSPDAAVQLHAVRLTIAYFTEALLPWLGGLWLVLSAWLIKPALLTTST